MDRTDSENGHSLEFAKATKMKSNLLTTLTDAVILI